MGVAQVSLACPDRTVLVWFLQDNLAEAGASQVELHVNSCSRCQQILAELLGQLTQTLVGAPPRTPSATLLQGTRDRDAALLRTLRAIHRAEDAEDSPPRLDGYDVLGPLGEGGMGVVWRVRDIEFGRDLALKVMKTRLCGEPGLERRFLNEAHICGRLTHPNIVPVHALGRLDDGRPYYLMKLVKGETLAARMLGLATAADRQRECLPIFAQVCQAVAYAHRQHVIHRDLKPANVMVGEHGEVQLMDWGLAKALAGLEAPGVEIQPPGLFNDTRRIRIDQTNPGSELGTWAYMPPEQARGLVEEMDQRSDVFGLGAILCEILTGKPPHVASDASALRRQASEPCLDNALAELHACGADANLIQLAKRCLAPNRVDRPADAGEVATAVAAYQAREEERLRKAELDEAAIAARRRVLRLTAMALTGAALPVGWGAYAFLAPRQRDPKQLRIGIKPWVGYTPLAVAQELDLCPPLSLQFVPIAALNDARQTLLRGEIDVAMWLVDTHVLNRSNDIRTKVVLQLDVSLTADAIVARGNIKKLANLIGKTVAYQNDEASYFLLLALCERYGIDDLLITLVPTTAKGAADLFVRGEVDAAATYDPHLSKALQVKGTHRLASGADVPGKIVDVLTVDEQYLGAHRDNVKALIAGWFKAVRILTDPTSAHYYHAMEIARKFNGDPGGADWKSSTPCSQAEYAAMAGGMKYSTRRDNLDFFRMHNGRSKFHELFSLAQRHWSARHRMGSTPTSPQDGDGSAILFEP